MEKKHSEKGKASSSNFGLIESKVWSTFIMDTL